MKKSRTRKLAAIAALFAALALVVLVIRPASAMPSTSTATVCFAGDESWDFSESSEKWPTPVEKTQFTSGGLFLDLAAPPRANGKQAGYVPVSDSLYNAAKYEANGKLGFAYTAVSGPQPGYQLRIDLDGNLATYEGILVHEAVYGDKWWATKVGAFPLIPDSTGGGSAKSATLQEFLDKYPTATIYSVGFSLGSGVIGSGTLKSFTFGNRSWSFIKYCGPVETSSTPVTTSTTPSSTSPSSSTPPSSSSESTAPTSTTPEPFYADCEAVRAALGHWIRVGEPGYRLDLDGDADGVACQALGAPVVVTSTTVPRVQLVDNSSPQDLAYTGVGTIVPLLGGIALLVLIGGGALVLITRRKA